MLSLVYSYYENPEMYLRQVQEWNNYMGKVKKNLSIYVTDDCSVKFPLRNIEECPKGLNEFKRYEITAKANWNWLACRNIGACYAKGDWIVLTDMDHLISAVDMGKLMKVLSKNILNERFIYLFERIDAPYNLPYKPHNDSFMMTKRMYWEIGGYDEELSGNYGTSGRYRARAFSIADGNERLKINLTRFPREVIPDASTVGMVRKGKGRDPNALKGIEDKKKFEGREGQIRILSFPYQEILR